MNYVLITRFDFQVYARNPHGLMELGFRDPQLHTTVLPQLINMPTLRTFLAPLWAGMQTSLTVRASLNGIALDHQLVAAESGFYLRVTWEGSPYLASQIEHMAMSHTQQLHRHPTIWTGGYIHNRGTTVYVPGGNRLIFSRKITLIGPNSESDIEDAVRRRFPDLAQENFGIGQVHLSYYLTEPVADPSWSIQLVIPIVEDDDTPVVLFKAVLSTYEGLGAIYVPSALNKHILITETGLDIVCGPQGELCACYHNGFQLGSALLEVADDDFISLYSVGYQDWSNEWPFPDAGAHHRWVVGLRNRRARSVMDAVSCEQCLHVVSEPRLFLPCYVLTRQGNPFHLLRPHGVMEVVWGHRQWVTAIALPKWINNYHCLGLFAQVCGPMLTSSCAIWCDNTRLSEELIECHIGSFVQVHIESLCSDLIRIDLQAALQRSILTLHLPGNVLHDDLVKMKIFVPQGVTCFSGATFECTSSFENWQAVFDGGRPPGLSWQKSWHNDLP